MTVDRGLDAEWAVTSFSPWDERLDHGNIWEIYRAIRDRAPAVQSRAHDELWLIGRYRDVKRAALDHRVFSSASGMFVGFDAPSDPRGAPIEYDPPDHTRLRAAMAGPFRPTKVAQFAPMVERHVAHLLDALNPDLVCDVVRDVAEPLAVSVISDIIGFGGSERDRNRELALALVNAKYDEMSAARVPYREFIGSQIDAGTTCPGEGMLGDIVRLSRTDPSFTLDELASMVYALALAGHHTTVYGIAAMLLQAADDTVKDRWLRDTSQPALGAFVDETLRIDPPIHLEARRTARPVDVGGVVVPRGAQVALLFGAANHDPDEFEDPEEFDPGRGTKSLAFGHGIHMCLGMELARLEMSTVLAGMLRRFPGFSLAAPPVDSGMTFGHLMGWSSVRVRLV